jgi:eukaryotic-like serine/threonine-protein kinase
MLEHKRNPLPDQPGISRRKVLAGLVAGSAIVGVGIRSAVRLLTYLSPLASHDTPFVDSLAWSPDGRHIASTSSLGEAAEVWNAATGQTLLTYDQGKFVHMNWVDWSPDGTRLASASPLFEESGIYVWDATTGRTLISHATIFSSSSLPGIKSGPVIWSPDSTRLASVSQDMKTRLIEIEIWDAITGKTLHTHPAEPTIDIFPGLPGTISPMAWSPDGTRLASAGNDDGSVQIWKATTGGQIVTYRGHQKIVYSVAWSPDGQRVVSGANDATAQVWEAATGERLLTYPEHQAGVLAVAWSPDGKHIVSGGGDGKAHVWNAATGETLLAYSGHLPEAVANYDPVAVFAVAWSPDGLRIASAGSRSVQVWRPGF